MSSKSSSFPLAGFFLACLCLLFITLKLTHFINWSWLWVLSPILIPVTLGVCGIIIYFGASFFVIALALKRKDDIKKAPPKHESKYMKALRENVERNSN